MKNIRICAALLIAALLVPMLAGCSLWTLDNRMDALENAVENRLDAVENAVENRVDQAEEAAQAAIRDAIVPANNLAPTDTPAYDPKPTDPPAYNPNTAATLSREEAEAIALTHVGFTADEITRLRTEYDWDDGVPHYDVEFHQGRWEYEYEIHAETGAILSYDRDD